MAAVHPISKQQDSLESLVTEWIECKKAEERANYLRLEVEDRILKMHAAPQEGSETVPLDNGLKLVLTGKITYSADMDALKTLAAKLPADWRPIKVEERLDPTGVKWLRANHPDAYAVIAEAITAKPAKVGFQVKV